MTGLGDADQANDTARRGTAENLADHAGRAAAFEEQIGLDPDIGERVRVVGAAKLPHQLPLLRVLMVIEYVNVEADAVRP